MDKRHIQKTGGLSYTVTLPKKWIEAAGLTSKDEVETYVHANGQLSIWPSKLKKTSSAIINIDYLSPERIKRELIAHYIAGFEEIIIQARTITSDQRSFIRSLSYKLIGFENFESTSSQIIFRNIAGNSLSASDFVNRMLSVLLIMYSDLRTALQTNNKTLARDIVERDDEVDRINLAITRQLKKKLYLDLPQEANDLAMPDLHYYSQVAMRLERLADHIVRIAKILLQLNGGRFTITRPEFNQMNRIGEYLEKCQTIVVTQDKRVAHQLLDLFESQKKIPMSTKK